MRTVPTEPEDGDRDEAGALAFIDHDRRRYAAKVPLPAAGEILVGGYLEDGSVGPMGELRIGIHDLGERSGLLRPRLCVFDDGLGALSALIEAAGGDLSELLASVAGHEELSGRLLALGLRDASELPLGEGGRA